METEEIRKKRGRPRIDGSRRNQMKTMVNDNELVRLREVSRKCGITQSDIVREGMNMYLSYLENMYDSGSVGEGMDDFERGMYDNFELEDGEF